MPNRRPTVTFSMETPGDHRRRMRRRMLTRLAYFAGVVGALLVPSPLCVATGATSDLASASVQVLTFL